MTASNRIGYGNYSSCSTLPAVKLDTVLNAQYTIRNASEHYSYVELAWTTGGASYDMSYFESTNPSFCPNHLTDVFSFATLTDTPCVLNGKNVVIVYSTDKGVLTALQSYAPNLKPKFSYVLS